MPGNFSFVTFHDGRHKTVSREQGIKMQQILDGLIEPDNEAQANYVLNIRRIDPLHGAAARKAELSAMDQRQAALDSQQLAAMDSQYRLNPGIEQGSYQGLPVNDR